MHIELQAGLLYGVMHTVLRSRRSRSRVHWSDATSNIAKIYFLLWLESSPSVLEKGTAGGTGSLRLWKVRGTDGGSAATALGCCWPPQHASLSFTIWSEPYKHLSAGSRLATAFRGRLRTSCWEAGECCAEHRQPEDPRSHLATHKRACRKVGALPSSTQANCRVNLDAPKLMGRG